MSFNLMLDVDKVRRVDGTAGILTIMTWTDHMNHVVDTLLQVRITSSYLHDDIGDSDKILMTLVVKDKTVQSLYLEGVITFTISWSHGPELEGEPKHLAVILSPRPDVIF